jgi:ABC-type spermidine/putrescine transport system permease subunit II
MHITSPKSWGLFSWAVSIVLIMPVFALLLQSFATDTALFEKKE